MSYFKNKVFFRNTFYKFSIITMAMLCIIGCSHKANVDQVNKVVGKSEHYTEKEINNAMDVVIQQFKSTNFNNCTLIDIWYNEKEVIETQTDWAEEHSFDKTIIINSNFKTAFISENKLFNSNTTYKDYKWILTKNNNENWECADSGYGF